MGLYEELGIRKVINASGTMTHLGGSIPDPRVMDAMKDASQNFVIMMELIEKTGKIIAELTGSEAGMVTSGSSAALVLGTAACIMKGSDLEKYEIQPMERVTFDQEWRELIHLLPDSSWARNEVIIQKAHRNPYDNAFKIAGGKLIVVGKNEGCSPEELKTSITKKTAAIAFSARVEDVGMSLKNVVEIARKNDIPVIVDAADELPPRANLKRYIAEGADLVVFSGGKLVSGPNDSGMLCGRSDLIKLAMLQAAPYRGIGRPMKIDRTQIVGLITALRIWLDKDEETEFGDWMAKAEWMANELKKARRVLTSEVFVERQRRRVYVHITVDENKGLSAAEITFNLRKGDISIWVNHIGSNKISIYIPMLKIGEEKIVASRIKEMLQ